MRNSQRVRLLIVALEVLGGCGRIGFDPAPDVIGTEITDASTDVPRVFHDEDGDGVNDDIDGCPHVAEASQVDTDNDTVNDPCDPEPANARQSIAWFLPLADATDPFTAGSADWIRRADAWRSTGPNAALIRPGPLRNHDVWIGLDVIAWSAIPRQINVTAVDASSVREQYGEIYETGAERLVAITEFTGTGYQRLDSRPIVAPLAPGPITFLMRARTSNPNLEAIIDLPGMRYQLQANLGGFTGRDDVLLQVGASTVEVRYMVAIATSP